MFFERKKARNSLVINIGGVTRYNSDSRKGAVLVCIYVNII